MGDVINFPRTPKGEYEAILEEARRLGKVNDDDFAQVETFIKMVEDVISDEWTYEKLERVMKSMLAVYAHGSQSLPEEMRLAVRFYIVWRRERSKA